MEGHGEVEVNLARYFNADTRNVPFGPVFNWVSEEGRNKSPFTTTGQRGPFWRGVLDFFLENVILHFSAHAKSALFLDREPYKINIPLSGML